MTDDQEMRTEEVEREETPASAPVDVDDYYGIELGYN